jgi:hypothetical protein
MRFSRTRLSDIVHRQAYAVVDRTAPSPPEHIAAGDLVIEGMETAI